jgi:hypothetical protein
MVLVPNDFLGQFCDVAKSGHHPEKVLAKFGYLSYVSFLNYKKDLSIFLATYWNLS